MGHFVRHGRGMVLWSGCVPEAEVPSKDAAATSSSRRTPAVLGPVMAQDVGRTEGNGWMEGKREGGGGCARSVVNLTT